MSVEVRDLTFSYGSQRLLHDVSFTTQPGEVIALLGPNGVGKSTLFRCMLGFLKPQAGSVLADGRDVREYNQKELAHQIAYIPQSYSPSFDYNVREVVLMGMTARLGLFSSPGREEEARAMQTMQSLGIYALADRSCAKISGGERQLMLLARALVQEAKVLLMDEPTASLDYGNSCRVMERVRALGEAGYTVIFSTHDPNQAPRYADRVLAMQDGALLADGSPEAVLTEQMLSRLYGVQVTVASVDAGGKTHRVLLPWAEEDV